jgi:hypothetical protein
MFGHGALSEYALSEANVVADTVDDLLANDVSSASSVSTPALGQVHALLANDVASASGVSIPTLRQVHGLLANDVASASSVSAPALGQVHGLLADDVASASSVTNPALGQVHGLLADDVVSASSVSVPALGQIHALAADDIESASSVSEPALTAFIPPIVLSSGKGSLGPRFRFKRKRTDPDPELVEEILQQRDEAVAEWEDKHETPPAVAVRLPTSMPLATRAALAELLRDERIKVLAPVKGDSVLLSVTAESLDEEDDIAAILLAI